MKLSGKLVSGFVFSLTTIISVFAQDNFSVSKINPVLIEQADAVIRYSETSCEILSKSESKGRERMVVTIFNEEGEETYGKLLARYDKFTKISDLTGVLYDASGSVIRKLKNADIEDYGYGTGSNEITDARIKLAGFGKKSYAYPYTIDYSYEYRDRNMMSYPRWIPAWDTKAAVENAVFKIKTPSGFVFRYKEYNGVAAVEKTKEPDGAEVYTWKLSNRPASSLRDGYPLPLIESTPIVLTAPEEFEVQDYKGNFKSWEDMGKFYYTLNQGRDVLPETTQTEIKNLVKGAKTDREKIVLIYKWMQARSRYVSIQLGIGGWQTIDAATVASKGYGDCKGLTNLTVSALRYAGVESYPVLIRAGKEATIKSDFPSNQFNHVIACAMAEKDTIWLECTSQTTPVNFMGTFTGGRPALLVRPEGGKLVWTPAYGADQNIRIRKTDIKLGTNGDAQLTVDATYKGLAQETRQNMMHSSNADEQKKWLLNQMNLPSLDLERFEWTDGIGSEPSVTEKLILKVRSAATKSGKRLFVNPGILSRHFVLPASTERTQDFYLSPTEYDFTDVDSVFYQLPEGFQLESALPTADIKSIFGSMEAKTVYKENKLFYVRKVLVKGGRYPASEYPNWIDFLKKIRRADRAQVVFVEKAE